MDDDFVRPFLGRKVRVEIHSHVIHGVLAFFKENLTHRTCCFVLCNGKEHTLLVGNFDSLGAEI